MLKRNSLQWLGLILVSLIFFNACVPIQREPASDAAAGAATETTVVAEAEGDEEPPERGAVVGEACDGTSQADIATILAEHDRIRQEATAIDGRNRAPKMNWSPELACQAEEWAKASVAGTQSSNPHQGRNPHSNLASWTNAPLAESIANGKEAAQDAVRAWEVEKADYDLKTGDCTKVCGHYEFIIMANMTEVGCGYATSTWVCQYKGTYPWEAGKDYAVLRDIGDGSGEVWWAMRAVIVDAGGIGLKFIFDDGTLDSTTETFSFGSQPDALPIQEAKNRGIEVKY